MKKALATAASVLSFLVSSVVVAGQSPCLARGPVLGQGSPPIQPSLFAPGIASTEHHDDWPPVFSPDGREMILRILGKVAGETVGVFFSSTQDESGCWSEPRPLPFSGTTMDGAIIYTADGKRLYFTSKRLLEDEEPAGSPRSRIWFSNRQESGWSDPVLLDSPINHFHVNGGISMAADGTIYAAMKAPGGLGMHDIYVLPLIDGRYPGFVPIPGLLNTSDQEVAPAVDPQQRFLLYTVRTEDGTTILISTPDENGQWSRGREIGILDGTGAKFGAITRDGSIMFFVSHRQCDECNPPSLWPIDLFDGPALAANADIYWLSVDEVLGSVPGYSEVDVSTITTTRLTERLYMLSTDQGDYTTNTLASVGEDGVLLVDTQAEGDAEALKRVVDAFAGGRPKIIINTHRHVEHIGGNAIFGDDALVIAHDLVPGKLRGGAYLFNEFPSATFPDITFADTMTLWFNGEKIRLTAFPGSHDDNEIAVHFTDSKVVHLSSLTNGFNFPSVDSDGDPLMFAELVGRAIEYYPEDVRFVSGHNGVGTMDDLRAYHEMMVATEEVVRRGLAAGKDAETLKKENVLEPWQHYAGSYVSADGWIDYLVSGIEPSDAEKPKIYEPIYHEMVANGTEAATAFYLELKKDHGDEYRFTQFDLLVIGDNLLKSGKIEPAIAFLELSLSEYPESQYLYYVNYDLALAHQERGDRDRALDHCRVAAELKPENEEIAQLLEELMSQ